MEAIHVYEYKKSADNVLKDYFGNYDKAISFFDRFISIFPEYKWQISYLKQEKLRNNLTIF